MAKRRSSTRRPLPRRLPPCCPLQRSARTPAPAAAAAAAAGGDCDPDEHARAVQNLLASAMLLPQTTALIAAPGRSNVKVRKAPTGDGNCPCARGPRLNRDREPLSLR